ncbi:ABC transporter ATP-binding protein [Paenibacillus beijingensis]|uniref:Daunorubicin ABC transporter ATP-binding protein n=1 Tax=Paenibacillus beijingensis TaxID=1126833 RepID=A0A0D5NG54_9BACL|nr:ABC transporter ATP-binding protein [Paenibacillus beijingensis]AJY74369.1 daunorubicin ABC transporter ATP-binding protein [Paenibacillus beijingensis]
MNAIEVKDLRKQFKVQKNREGLAGALQDLFKREYREVTAVKDISFQIPQGEICGYIGENGAGKSTTIKMLTGILVPTSGHLKVNGYVPYKDREKFVSGIGVVFGQRSQLWWDIGVIESFQLLRKVYRVPEADYRKRLDELVERLQLGELLNRPVRKLSLGQRMRCELVASLLHNPSILFLDEPTIGLDIVVKTEIREFLKQLNKEHGTTILLTTHDLQDIEALCSRVIMLDDGKIIYDGGLEELKSRWSKGREIQFQFANHYSLKRMEELTAGLEGVTWRRENELTAMMWLPHSVNVSDALSRVVGAAEIRDIKIFETNTDEIVREIYSSGSASAPADLDASEDGDGGSGEAPEAAAGSALQAGGAGAVPEPEEALSAAGAGMTEPGESGALEAAEGGTSGKDAVKRG